MTDGLDVVNKIAETDTDWNDAPLDPQVIRTSGSHGRNGSENVA